MQPSDRAPASRPKQPVFEWYSRAFHAGLLGLLFLWAEPGAGAKIFGAGMELLAAFSFVRAVRNRRENLGLAPVLVPAPPQPPETYAELQAAMARLREMEDQDRRGG